jgi:hypothetical protein
MKKLMLLTTCLAFFSLACLTTTVPLSATPTVKPEATKSLVIAADLVQEQDKTITPTTSLRSGVECAVISANQALHLRVDADPKSRVLAFMMSGEVVRLISHTDGTWWLVQRGNLIGYARAKYMQESECGK